MTIRARSTLGELDYEDGRFEESTAQFEAALASAEQVLGPEHVQVADLSNNLSGPLLALGRPEPAVNHLRRARAIYANLPDHEDDLAMVAFNLGNLLGSMERPEEAKVEFAQAAESWAKSRGPHHPHTLRARVGSAMILSDLGNPKSGLVIMQDVLPRFDLDRDGAALMAEMHWNMAHVAGEAGDLDQAYSAADEGQRLAKLDPEGSQVVIDLLEQWQREHPR